MKKDVDYVAKDGEIVIVDEFTGRLMFGRRYSEGLHQAIEAKEGLHLAPLPVAQPYEQDFRRVECGGQFRHDLQIGRASCRERV